MLKILFNGGEDGDAIPLEELENTEYYSILAINSAYHLDSQTLIKSYKLSHQRSSLDFESMPASRSKTIYHSKNTIEHRPKKEKSRQSSIRNLPPRDDILRLLRMRHEQNVEAFLHNEFEKRNKVRFFAGRNGNFSMRRATTC